MLSPRRMDNLTLKLLNIYARQPPRISAMCFPTARRPGGISEPTFLPGRLPLVHKVGDMLVDFGLVGVAEKVHAILQKHQLSFGGIGEELDFLLRICRAEDDVGGALCSQ